MPPVPLLQARGVGKQFPGVRALDDVSVDLYEGEVLALVGENGAGKSTLMKILAGVQRPDTGELRLDGRPVQFAGIADALKAGVCLIHQEVNLAESLSVVANLFLGREETWAGVLGLLDNGRMRREARRMLDRLGLDIDPDARTGDLGPGPRQLVEIARALGQNARVLIMDEPTSSLTQRETDRLYEVVDRLRADKVSVVYISHRLGEVQRLADRAVVLRDGKNAGELPRAEINHQNLVRHMVGRDLKQFFQKEHPFHPVAAGGGAAAPAPPRIELRDVRFVGDQGSPVSFSIRPGEIVGMSGLVGAGRTELAEAVFGIRPLTGGQVLIDGAPVAVRAPPDAIRAGVALVPEDRRLHGLVLAESIRENIGLPNFDRLSYLRLVLTRTEANLARDQCERLRVRTPSVEQTAGLLSGGNQQKVVLGKWLARGPKVLILDEPTRGIDVGAKSEIYALMDRLAGDGVGIWMISSDLEEIIGVSDRVLVMHQGRLAGELPRDRLSEQAVMTLATGGGTHP